MHAAEGMQGTNLSRTLLLECSSIDIESCVSTMADGIVHVVPEIAS